VRQDPAGRRRGRARRAAGVRRAYRGRGVLAAAGTGVLAGEGHPGHSVGPDQRFPERFPRVAGGGVPARTADRGDPLRGRGAGLVHDSAADRIVWRPRVAADSTGGRAARARHEAGRSRHKLSSVHRSGRRRVRRPAGSGSDGADRAGVRRPGTRGYVRAAQRGTRTPRPADAAGAAAAGRTGLRDDPLLRPGAFT